MTRKLDPVPLVVVTSLLIGGCVFGWRKKDATEAKPSPTVPTSATGPDRVSEVDRTAQNVSTTTERDARVQPGWQSRMFEELAPQGDAFVEVWGLFSEGGWSDAGQIIILANPDRSQSRLMIVAPNKRDVSRDRILTKEEWRSLEPHLKTASTLADINETVFDGIVFELVHAKQVGSQSQLIKRLFIKQAGNKTHPDHDALLNAFQALKK